MFYINKKEYIKELNRIAVPLIIQNISCMLIGLIDEAFLGHISVEAYSAVGIVTTIMNFIAGVFGYFSVAFNISGAKIYGEKKNNDFSLMFTSLLIIDIFVGALYGMFSILICEYVYIRFYSLTGIALKSAVDYTIVASPYMVIQMLIFSMNAYYKIIKKTSHLMVAAIISTIINTVLDYILIYGKLGFPAMGVKGAAIASIISVATNCIILLIKARTSISFKVDIPKDYYKNIITIIRDSLPLIGNELLEGSVMIVIVNAMVAGIGVIEIGGYMLVNNLLNIFLISMYMYGAAELTLVSERIGANKVKEIPDLMKSGVAISSFIYIFLILVILPFRYSIIGVITNDIKLITCAVFIFVPIAIANILKPIQVIYKYVLQAFNESKFVLYGTFIVNAISLLGMYIFLRKHETILTVAISLLFNYMLLIILYRIRLNKVERGLDIR